MTRHSLSGRITVLLGMATVLILGGAAVLMDHMVDSEMGQRLDAGLLAQARTLAALADVGPQGLDMDEVARPHAHLLTRRAAAFWAIRCADGSLAHSEPAPMAYPPDWTRSARTPPTFADVGTGEDTLRAVWFGFDPGASDEQVGAPQAAVGTADVCSLVFMQPRGEFDEILATIDGILLLIPLLALLAVLLLSPVLVRRGLKPLTKLGEDMRGIGPQVPGQRLPATGTRELEPLVARFNEVLTRMDEGVTRERQFAGALAHETRTRLAELRSLVEVEQRYPGGRPVATLLQEIGSIGGELENTVSGLLLLTRLDAGIESLALGKVHLDEVISRQLEHLANILQQRRLRVDMQPLADAPTLIADGSLLDIVIGNLLSNAAVYAPAGSVIEIRQQQRALVIGNHAPDVDADEVARFGQRFWSKHHGADGHAGLGLALAGAAATAMALRLQFSLDAEQRLHATLSWRDSPETAHDAQPS